MAITETIELLGKGLYGEDIPDTLTLIPMTSTLQMEYEGSESLETTLLDSILPKCVQEKIDFRKLLNIDFQWVLRALRILTFGEFHTTDTIFCRSCDDISRGEYRVNITTIPCRPLPEGFKNTLKIRKEDLMDCGHDIEFKLLTVQEIINARKDKAFTIAGKHNIELARVCYMISSMNGKKDMKPFEVRLEVDKLSGPDWVLLKSSMMELLEYGLEATGSTKCPKCGEEAVFIALVDERFLFATVGDIREWRNSGGRGKAKNISADTAAANG